MKGNSLIYENNFSQRCEQYEASNPPIQNTFVLYMGILKVFERSAGSSESGRTEGLQCYQYMEMKYC